MNRDDLPERYAVFYGRIGAEKGIRILQRVWNELDDIPLVVMGGGPLEESLRHGRNSIIMCISWDIHNMMNVSPL